MNDNPGARPPQAREPIGWHEAGPLLPLVDQEPAVARVRDGGLWLSRRKFQDRTWLHLLLFVLTVGSTTVAGAGWYSSFALEYFVDHPHVPISLQLLHGLWYSLTILAILGCHEFGHYFACRYYDVDASLPFFLPMPLLLTGTLGAVIRIREPIHSKRIWFDVGIAGPIAGFAVAVPALFIGVWMSRMDPPIPTAQLSPGLFNLALGEPLLFKFASWLVWGAPPEGLSLNLHPVAIAGWFGLIVTAINLVPVAQLDGGHLSYAVFGRRSSAVTIGALSLVVACTYFSRSWLVWAGLMGVMLAVYGRHHPRTFDETEPLDRPRLILAIAALAIFAICFTPAPLEIVNLTVR
jgi:membrane-associated protease RseP (regulator of RpoE activity)